MSKGNTEAGAESELMKRVVNNYPQISRLPPPVRERGGRNEACKGDDDAKNALNALKRSTAHNTQPTAGPVGAGGLCPP